MDDIITAFKSPPSWEDKLIKNIKYLNDYNFKVYFKNGEIKVIDIEPYIHKHEKIFKSMIENQKIIKNVKIEPMGMGIYWNDLMGIEAQTLYDLTDN